LIDIYCVGLPNGSVTYFMYAPSPYC
jgi:hypothetical protein